MAVQAEAVTAPSGVSTRLEWWERLRDRFASWAAAHAELVRACRVGWLMLCVSGLLCFAVAAVLFPNVWAAGAVYAGVGWLLLCWFVLARTKTLTLGAFTMLYGVCVPWSVAIGQVSLHLAALMPPDWPLRGASTFGPAVGIAAVAEESLKLLPVAALVVLAPGRVRRFAAVDWLLVGVASGAGFLTAEEVQRRLSLLAPTAHVGLLNQMLCGSSVAERIDCYGITRFGLNPFAAKPAATGLSGLLDDSAVQYAGHHVLTGLVAAAVGLGIVVWRAAGRLGPVGRRVHRVGAVGLPLLMLWVAIADHVVFNAEWQAGGALSAGHPWLGAASTVAAPFRWWYYVGGRGHGRAGLLLLVLVVAMLCDATRASKRGWWSVVPQTHPRWVDRALAWCRGRLGQAEATGLARPLRDAVVATVVAAVALAYVAVRDLTVGVAAHARLAQESRWEAMLRGRAVLVMQRETREIAAAADANAARSRRGSFRLVGLTAAVLLVVLALVVAPRVATSLGWDTTFSTRWLAGLFDALAVWWGSLTPGQQLLLTVALAAAIAIPLGFGAGFFLAGGLTYLAAHGHGVAALLRDPKGATRSYLTHRSLGGMAFDAGEFALTFVPAGFGSAGGAVGRAAVRGALAHDVERFLADPAAWRAARAAAEQGSVSLDVFGKIFRVNGRRPINGEKWAGEVFANEKKWTAALQAKYPKGVRFTSEGFPDFSPYATHTYTFEGGFTGNRKTDSRIANEVLGFKDTPKYFTWHHVEDGKTLRLVPTDLHNAVRHTGGHAVVRPPK